MTTNQGAPVSDHRCTCCNPARPMRLYSPDGEWCHVDDETYAEVFHVHASTSSADCDGPHASEHTYQITSMRWTPEELSHKSPPEPDAFDLWNKLCRFAPAFHNECEVEVTANGTDDGTFTLRTGHRTDEGFHSEQLVGCKDPYCAHAGESQRDRFAEQMGY